jgi:hypothetical protein
MKKVFEILDAEMKAAEKELERLRAEFDRSQANDVYHQGEIAHKISIRVAELEALYRFKRRLQRENL